ncbi:surfeit locus protein 1 [Argentina anserina]|uniref:surfeit locus protein 1 n=1 Tax=Argentina anserina TaxID=57926 RepID=UPI00217653FE|nr:surfeit locus protein 1 [Potentilla anserina]
MATTKTSLAKTISKLYSRNITSGSLSSIPKHLGSFQSSSSFSSTAAAADSVVESQSAVSSQASERERSRWSKWLLFLPGAITFGLGTWQIVRRQDKIKMLEYRRERLEMGPLKFYHVSPSTEELDDLEFRRVLCKGHFDEKRSIYVGPRSRSISGLTENGYYIITPLLPVSDKAESSQRPILVNRGWVPRSWKDKSSELPQDDEQPSKTTPTFVNEEERASWWGFWSKKPKVVEDQPPTHALDEVVGVIRGSEKPSIFVPPNDPNSGQWFYVDVPAIARSVGLPEDTIYIEDIHEGVNPSNPYPLPKDGNTLIRSSVMPQDHLNYTLTWYSLSAAVTFMAFMRLRPKKIRR